MGKRKVGKPLKLTAEVIKNVCEAVSIGTPLAAASVYGGISYRSHINYYNAGADEFSRLEEVEGAVADPAKRLFLQYFLGINKAKADAAVTWAQVLNNAATVDPRWAFEMLKKWYPETYGETIKKVELTGADGGAIEQVVKIDFSNVSDDQLDKLIEAAERLQRPASGEAEASLPDVA